MMVNMNILIGIGIFAVGVFLGVVLTACVFIGRDGK